MLLSSKKERFRAQALKLSSIVKTNATEIVDISLQGHWLGNDWDFFFNYRSSTLSSPHVAPIGVTEATKLSLLSSQRDECFIVQLLVRLQQT